MKNISIYDNQGETFDRITIVFDNKKTKTRDGIIYEGIGASEDGRGFLQHTTCMKGKHLGKKITFEELHKNLQDFIKNYQSQNK